MAAAFEEALLGKGPDTRIQSRPYLQGQLNFDAQGRVLNFTGLKSPGQWIPTAGSFSPRSYPGSGIRWPGALDERPSALEGMPDNIVKALQGLPAARLDPATIAELFQQGVASPALREYDRTIKPRIDEAFAGYGTLFSSRKADAARGALEELNANLSAQLAQTQMQGMFQNAAMTQQSSQQGMQNILAYLSGSQQAAFVQPGQTTYPNLGEALGGALGQSPLGGQEPQVAQTLRTKWINGAELGKQVGDYPKFDILEGGKGAADSYQTFLDNFKQSAIGTAIGRGGF